MKKTLYWFERAAKLGSSLAQCNVAYMYDRDKGVEKDNVKAIKYYTFAALQDDKIAQYNLALKYYRGSDVKKRF